MFEFDAALEVVVVVAEMFNDFERKQEASDKSISLTEDEHKRVEYNRQIALKRKQAHISNSLNVVEQSHMEPCIQTKSLTDDQRRRIEYNRQLALQRKQARRIAQSSVVISASAHSSSVFNVKQSVASPVEPKVLTASQRKRIEYNREIALQRKRARMNEPIVADDQKTNYVMSAATNQRNTSCMDSPKWLTTKSIRYVDWCKKENCFWNSV